MATVTMELRDLLTMTNFDLFDFDYKCDFPEWREELEQAIKDEYYFSEIGQETPDRFKHYFRTLMRKIMPYYNSLYASTLLDGNPLINYKMTEETTGTGSNEGGSTGSTETTGAGTQTKTDYPQTGDPITDIPTEQNSATDQGSTKTNITNTSTSSTDMRKVVEGISGTSYAKLIKEHRENLLKINALVINELKPCFILVY